MNLRVKRFNLDEDKSRWNFFVKEAKNATFLFDRNFMDYHSDRFHDHSLLVFNEKENLIACFPANEVDGNKIISHGGLTYGGFILKSDLKLPVILQVYTTVLQYYHDQTYSEIVYKAFPRFYNQLPADEIDYCLFRSNATLYRRDTAFVIDQLHPIKYASNIRREANKARSVGFEVSLAQDFGFFWEQILTANLKARFNVNPVHSLAEINLLKNNFPDNIKLYVVKDAQGAQLAGVVLFETSTVAHCQYISSTDEGRKSGALNLLLTELIDVVYKDKRFFDFGIANEDNGKVLNHGLLSWKERMGGRAISHDFYTIPTKSYRNILAESGA